MLARARDRTYQGLPSPEPGHVRPAGAATDARRNLLPKSRAITRRQLPRQAISSSSFSRPPVLLRILTSRFVRDLQGCVRGGRFVAIVRSPNVRYVLIHCRGSNPVMSNDRTSPTIRL